MFVSYAQNFEDVLLWRALKHVENGFYLDIGAQDPVVDSVSRGFYEQGWRGVHLEPTSEYFSKLKKNRPDETVLQNAVGEGDRNIRFFEFPETGLSTGDPDFAAQHEAKGFKKRETQVQLVPLAELLDKYGNRDIHWMKIDVEGMEASVLASWGTSAVRPWVVVVESTIPLSAERAEVTWQHHLTTRDYKLCYFDGLNCYFVSKEHGELEDAFVAPPNVFDGFTLSGTATSPMSARMISLVAEARGQRDHAEQRLSAVTAQAEIFHSQILSLHNSFSWRITRPLRVFSRLLNKGLRLLKELPRRVLSRLKLSLRFVLLFLLRFVQKNPRAYDTARKIVNRNAFLRRIASRLLKISSSSSTAPRSMHSMISSDGSAQRKMFELTNKELNTLSRVGRIKARQIGVR